MIPEKMARLLGDARKRGASDIHICAGAPALYRIGRELVPATRHDMTPELSRELAYSVMTPEAIHEFEHALDADFMLADDAGRYRVNVCINNGSIGAVIRILPEEPPSLESLNLPPIVTHLAHNTKGIILITGSTSQGKTTTMSGMIDEVNAREKKHIITIEDPVEFVHKNKKGVVRQREVGSDTHDFHSGLRAALRQDPDVIAIGEMRDYESIRIALTAAETGVFVLSTIHIISIDKFIERMLSYAPSEEEGHLRYLLADSLQAIIHQELLPTTDGGKRVACEVLVVTDAARNIIRKRGAFQLRNIIATGAQWGMVPMTQSVEELRDEGLITEDVMRSIAANYGG